MLILASSSPRRRELLARAGIAFEVQAVNTPEEQRAGESPLEYCRRLAHEKAASIWNARKDALVLGADTIVIVDNQVLGKPRDPADARRMLSLISGRAHDVTTAVCLLYSESGAHRQLQEEVTTRVFVDPLTESDIEEYVRSGEPLDKAGAYAIQGIASRWIYRVEGEYSNVVGLPVATVQRMLQSMNGVRQAR
jgi:septum formation protein